MRPGAGVLQYQPLRAPRRHGEALISPPLSAVQGLVEQNASLLQCFDYDCQGVSWPWLSAAARQSLLEQARRYTAAYRDVDLPATDISPPFLVTGHQPQLFHPGVWFKNFALSVLGRRLGAHAVHLLIDNDAVGSVSISSPRFESQEVRVETHLLDRATEITPYEERRVLDQDLFASFGDRVRLAVKPLGLQPLVTQLWPQAVEASRRGAPLGQCVAEARHCLESRCGLATIELPLSAVCQDATFRWFAVHILAQLPRFRQIHNESLAEYRRVNGVRSRTHPVPDLGAEGEWLEAPFWLWTRADPQRRPLFVRPLPNELELTDRAQVRLRLPLSADSDGRRAVDQLAAGPWRNVKLRPRALITTMYARLALADLFLHGIGGAKYDQLTDLLIDRFFGCEPPGFLTLTATAHLPLDVEPVEEADLSRLDRLVRELRYQPEKHAPPGEEVNRLAALKRRWIEARLPRGHRLERHRSIERINQEFQPFVAASREQLLARRRQVVSALRTKSILASREYSFCLFSRDALAGLLLELLGEGP